MKRIVLAVAVTIGIVSVPASPSSAEAASWNFTRETNVALTKSCFVNVVWSKYEARKAWMGKVGTYPWSHVHGKLAGTCTGITIRADVQAKLFNKLGTTRSSFSRSRAAIETVGFYNAGSVTVKYPDFYGKPGAIKTIPLPPAAKPKPKPVAIPDQICAKFGSQCRNAQKIAHCESTMNPAARRPGSQFYGLFQIGVKVHAPLIRSMGYSADDMLKAGPNIAVAHRLYSQQGWGPWSCKFVL